MAFFLSWWRAWVSCFFINEGMGCVSSASGRVINSAGKDLKSSSLPLHGQRRRGTVPFKTALFFFFKEKKCNLEEEKKRVGSDPKMGYDTSSFHGQA
jgi:hypothetical protein